MKTTQKEMYRQWNQLDVLLLDGLSAGTFTRVKRQAAVLAYAAGSVVSMITEKLFNWFSPARGREKELEKKYVLKLNN